MHQQHDEVVQPAHEQMLIDLYIVKGGPRGQQPQHVDLLEHRILQDPDFLVVAGQPRLLQFRQFADLLAEALVQPGQHGVQPHNVVRVVELPAAFDDDFAAQLDDVGIPLLLGLRLHFLNQKIGAGVVQLGRLGGSRGRLPDGRGTPLGRL